MVDCGAVWSRSRPYLLLTQRYYGAAYSRSVLIGGGILAFLVLAHMATLEHCRVGEFMSRSPTDHTLTLGIKDESKVLYGPLRPAVSCRHRCDEMHLFATNGTYAFITTA